jgi:hypothetical protein
VGFRGLSLLIWAWFVNAGLHLVGGVTVFALVARLTRSRGLAYTALAAFLLNGPLLWGAYSHMEVALFSTLTLLTLLEAVRLEATDAQEGARLDDADNPEAGAPASAARVPRRLLVLGGMLALIRPEGMLMAGGLSLWLLWRHLGQEPAAKEPAAKDPAAKEPAAKEPTSRLAIAWLRHAWSALRQREALRLAIPLGVGVALLLLYLALTGRFSTNAAIKSHLKHLAWDPGLYLSKSVGWLPMTVQILLEKWPRIIQPLTTILFLGGLGFWAARGRLRRPGAGALVLGWLLLLTLFYALFVARRDHFDRYYLPYLGLTLVAMWWALGQLARRLPSLASGPVVLSALFLLFMLPQTRSWAARYGDHCRDLVVQHFKVAEWLREKTPPGTRIAVNDAGAMPYLSDRYSYDIVGLCHNAFLGRKTHMPFNQAAPVWEALEELPGRPDYMVAYPEWIPDLHRLRPFKSIERFPVKNRTVVANETKIVWKMEWDLLLDPNRAPPPVTGQPPAAGQPPVAGHAPKLMDRIDVADLASERAHGYRRLDTGQPEGLVYQELHDKRALIDGGRRIELGEELRLSARPGKPAVLVMRTLGPGPLDLDVFVDGREVGRWRAQRPVGFSVPHFIIDGPHIRGELVTVRLESRKKYTSFHFWLMQ